MWELDYKDSWVPKNWCFWTVVLEKTLGSHLDPKGIKPVNPKGNQPWRKKREKNERRQYRIWTPCEELNCRRGSCTQGSPLTDGEIIWDGRGASEAIEGGWNSWSVADRTEWDLYRWSVPKPCTPKPGTCVCQFTVGAESWNIGIGDETQDEDCYWL